MTNSPEITGKVVFVDDNLQMREALTELAMHVGVKDVEVFEDANGVITRLENSDENPAVIFSDGLNGDWKRIIGAAKDMSVPAFVISATNNICEEVESEGVTFIPKVKLSPDLLRSILTDLQSMLD